MDGMGHVWAVLSTDLKQFERQQWMPALSQRTYELARAFFMAGLDGVVQMNK